MCVLMCVGRGGKAQVKVILITTVVQVVSVCLMPHLCNIDKALEFL